MEIFKPTSLLILLLVSCGVFCAEAQKRPQRTSSARAYYGEAKLKPKLAKKKKQKSNELYPHQARKRNPGGCMDYQKKISAFLSCEPVNKRPARALSDLGGHSIINDYFLTISMALNQLI